MLDVAAAMDERPETRNVRLNVVGNSPSTIEPMLDPFAEVEV